MDEKAPEAPVSAPAEKSEATTPTNTNSTTEAPAPAVEEGSKTTETVDLHGFTPEQLAEMKKFYDANGGFEKVKAKISNPDPKPAEPQIAPQQTTQQVPTNNQQISDPSIVPTDQLFLKDFFERLSERPEYASIKSEIASGEVLKEAQSMGMDPVAPNGIKLEPLMKFLNLKAKSMPAPQTSSEPEASPAPTVGYIPVGENIESKEQAYQILQQNVQLKAMGQAEHPATAKAKEFLKGNWGK